MTNQSASSTRQAAATNAPCPSNHLLDALVRGELSNPDQALIIAHLDACPRCRTALDRLTSDFRPPTSDLAAPSPSLLRLIDQIKSASPATHFDSTSTDGDSPTPLDFLSPTDDTVHLGRLGRYLVQEEIGRGASGIVLKALDEQLGRIVALKVLAPRLATNENARRRFVREARAAAAIRDDHVIGIHHVEEVDGLPFLVMEYIVGRSLQQRMDADGPLPLPDILRIGSQIARGLAAAHAQGLVHRDIKPANTQFTTFDSPKTPLHD